MNLLTYICLVIIGFTFLVKGADWFVEGTSGIASKMGIPQLVIGLTIVAMGTSAPEAAVSITSAFKGSADIAVGNVLGSNILNILVILGITSIITPLLLQNSTIRYEIPFMIFVTIVFGIVGLNNYILGWLASAILLFLFIVYLAYLYYMSKKGFIDSEEDNLKSEQSMFKLIILSVIGVVLIIIGSNFAVDGATGLARVFGVSERVIGLTIVALGTSLPELVTSVTAALKNKADIAIGNIVGSNVFNILFVIGISSAITPVPYQSAFFFDTVVAVLSAVLLYLLILNKDRQLKRCGGVLMLIIYAGYLVYLL